MIATLLSSSAGLAVAALGVVAVAVAYLTSEALTAYLDAESAPTRPYRANDSGHRSQPDRRGPPFRPEVFGWVFVSSGWELRVASSRVGRGTDQSHRGRGCLRLVWLESIASTCAMRSAKSCSCDSIRWSAVSPTASSSASRSSAARATNVEV